MIEGFGLLVKQSYNPRHKLVLFEHTANIYHVCRILKPNPLCDLISVLIRQLNQ